MKDGIITTFTHNKVGREIAKATLSRIIQAESHEELITLEEALERVYAIPKTKSYVLTTCIIQEEQPGINMTHRVLARGYAICRLPLDQYNRRAGNALALERARKALIEKASSGPEMLGKRWARIGVRYLCEYKGGE